MKSRIPKIEKTDNTIRIDIASSKKKANKKDKKEKTIIVSGYSKQKINESDMINAKTVMDRHSNTDETDIFGRKKMPDDAPNIVLKCLATTQPSPVISKIPDISSDVKYVCVPYKIRTKEMLQDYSKMLIKENIIKPMTDLKKYPIIDMHKLFIKYNKSAREWTDTITMNFDDDEKIILDKLGTDIFKLPFPQVFIQINKHRYIFLDIKKKDNIFDINEEIYIYDDDAWLMYSKLRMELSFYDTEPRKFDINIIDSMTYEQILSDFTNKMNWTKTQKKLWTESFEIPECWKDISIVTLLQENEQETNMPPMLLTHNNNEKTALKKICGEKNVRSTSNYLEAESEMAKMYVSSCLPEIIQILSAIAILRTEQRRPDETEISPDGKRKQRFGQITITANENIPW